MPIRIYHDESGRIVGHSRDPLATGGIVSDVDPDTLHLYCVADGQLTADVVAHRAQAVARIKAAAAEAIDALAWRIERARERDEMGLPGETVETVLTEREAIRRASNRIEAAIEAMDDVAEIAALALEITEADATQPARLTRKAFLDRFSDVEMQTILAAIDATPALRAWYEKFSNAQGVVLTDPQTIAGAQALEIAGLIAPGRAAEILAV
jgi:hypothetical protein